MKEQRKRKLYSTIYSKHIYAGTFRLITICQFAITLLPLQPGTPGIPRGPIAPACPGKPFWPSIGNKPSSPYLFEERERKRRIRHLI